MLDDFDEAAADQEALQEIATMKAELAACRAAVMALLTGNQSYMLNTGQTQMTVTRANFASVQARINQLRNDIAVATARLYGLGISHAKANF